MSPLPLTLIFDLDNTLIDRNQAMRSVTESWLRTQGYNEQALQSLMLDEIMERDNWGYTNRDEFCDWLLHTYGSKESQETSPKIVLDYILRNISHYIQPYPLVQATLIKASKSFRLVLATNGRKETQRAKLRQAKLEAYFLPENSFISGEIGYQKPENRFYEQIIQKLQLDPKKAMFIGDDPVNDVSAPRACGFPTCWVSHGRSTPDSMETEIVIHQINEIEKWLIL